MIEQPIEKYRSHPELAPTPNSYPIPKVEKFGWVKQGEPTELVWIDKNELSIDLAYQRDTPNKALIKDISRSFHWVAFGALAVAMRGGKWFIIDGGHRWKGVMLRADIQKVPCLVYESQSAVDEAQTFLRINGNRRAVCAFDAMKAKLAAQEQDATELSEILASSGFRFGPTGAKENVPCVNTVFRLFKSDKARFVRLWPVVVSCHAASRSIDGRFAKALFELDAKTEGGLTRVQIDKLVAVGAEAAIMEMTREAIKQGSANPSVWACALSRLTKKRITSLTPQIAAAAE